MNGNEEKAMEEFRVFLNRYSDKPKKEVWEEFRKELNLALVQAEAESAQFIIQGPQVAVEFAKRIDLALGFANEVAVKEYGLDPYTLADFRLATFNALENFTGKSITELVQGPIQ